MVTLLVMVSLAPETKFGVLKFSITLDATKYMPSIVFIVAFFAGRITRDVRIERQRLCRRQWIVRADNGHAVQGVAEHRLEFQQAVESGQWPGHLHQRAGGWQVGGAGAPDQKTQMPPELSCI